MVLVSCPFCKHNQETKSKLKNITCSSCRKKFPNAPIYNSEPDKENSNVSSGATEEAREETKTEEKGETKKVKLD